MSRAATVSRLAGGVAVALLVTGHFSARAEQARERVLYVNVFDQQTKQPVPDLGPEAFVVREDGVAREVLRVTKATTPLPIALLVDNSQAASSAIADIRRAVTTFFTASAGLGPIALITVADRPTIVVDYTTSAKDLEAGVGRLFAQPDSGATLLDAIKESSQGLAKREGDRAALVVLTTENREFSTLHHTQVLEAVKKSGAAFHAVVLLNPAGSLTNEEARNRATVLDRGPRELGGVRIDVLTSNAFEGQMRNLAGILTSQYRVIYARPESLIPPERVEVSMAKPGLEAHGAPARGQSAR
jgi:VWFA-related protein